jgi:hypothetical protein
MGLKGQVAYQDKLTTPSTTIEESLYDPATFCQLATTLCFPALLTIAIRADPTNDGVAAHVD